MSKSKPSHPQQALLDAGAEISMETLKARRWIFLAAAVVIGIGFPAIGIAYAVYQSGFESILFGGVFTTAGVLGSLGALNAYRKAGQFAELYEEKLAKRN